MRIDDKPREECAVFGVSTRTGGAAALTMNGLLTLQHRGQEGAGIAVAQAGGILCPKDAGLVGAYPVFDHRREHPGERGALRLRIPDRPSGRRP